MASPDLSELNHIDKPQNTRSNWAISFADTLYLNLSKVMIWKMLLYNYKNSSIMRRLYKFEKNRAGV